MESHDVLLTMAELAVAFIGFAGLVVVFQRRQGEAWDQNDVLRFWLMIVAGLLALVFSLLPLLFIAAGRSAESTWAICSGAMAVFLAINAATLVLGALGRIPGFSRLLSALVLLLALPSLLVVVLNVCDVVFHRGLTGYLVGLFYLICLSGAFFARLVYLGIARAS